MLSKYYTIVISVPFGKEKGSWKVVVPHNISSYIIKYYHSPYGNFGANKTYNPCKELFTWKNMRKMMASQVISCAFCTEVK